MKMDTQMETGTKTCPVCNMKVSSDNYALTFEGLHFAFCSEQCRERFTANPHLYVGRPGQPAPKQQGKEIIKLRSLQLQQALAPEDADTLISELKKMMGIEDVTVDGRLIHIRYDLLQATAEQIEAQIEKIGKTLGGGLGDKLRRAFIHYLEETELDNLEVTGSEQGHHHH